MTLTAVLLAGGESRRMGQDKANAHFEGEPLWRRQFRLLRQLQPQELFLSARSDQPWRPPEMRLVLDQLPSRGPMSGIASSLAVIQTSHLLILAVDMPFLLQADLLRLVSLSRDGRGAVPFIENRSEPLAAVYPQAAKDEFVAALMGSTSSLQPVIRRLVDLGQLQRLDLREDDAARYRSLNYPEDLNGS